MIAAVTRVNRHEVMAEVNDAVIGAGGWVEGHTLFSNIATTFQIMLAHGKIDGFLAAIEAAGVHIDDPGATRLAAQSGREGGTEDEVPLSLNVTFIHDEPDLRRDVPMVPG